MADPEDAAHTPPESLWLLAEEIVLELPAVEQVLSEAVAAAAEGVGLSCGITYVARYGVLTVASSDELANAVDEIQYDTGMGPCLEALHTRKVVRVDDQQTDPRWDRYRELALSAGVRSSLSLPLIVDDRAVGALNVYSTRIGPLPVDQEAAAIVASGQIAGVLQAVRRLAGDLLRDPDTARSLQARHELDIATGIVMAQRGCSGNEARALLAEQAAAAGVSVHELAVRLVVGDDRPTGPTA